MLVGAFICSDVQYKASALTKLNIVYRNTFKNNAIDLAD